MEAKEKKNLIVVKKIKKGGHGHHGGAWKIAYADFVTAMMAFFLLLWLLGSVGKYELQGISDYFAKPLKVALSGGSGSGDRTSVIKDSGGGDITRKEGQQKAGDKTEVTSTDQLNSGKSQKKDSTAISEADVQAMNQKIEQQKLEEVKKKLDAEITNNPDLSQYKSQISMEVTSEGLRIQLMDEENKPMFSIGSSEPEGFAKAILAKLGKELNNMPNKILITGYTDAKPYSGSVDKYSNWELSVDRANAARRELFASGLKEEKILRVAGSASNEPLDKKNLLNPVNRRVTIVVLNKKAESTAKNNNL